MEYRFKMASPYRCSSQKARLFTEIYYLKIYTMIIAKIQPHKRIGESIVINFFN